MAVGEINVARRGARVRLVDLATALGIFPATLGEIEAGRVPVTDEYIQHVLGKIEELGRKEDSGLVAAR